MNVSIASNHGQVERAVQCTLRRVACAHVHHRAVACRRPSDDECIVQAVAALVVEEVVAGEHGPILGNDHARPGGHRRQASIATVRGNHGDRSRRGPGGERLCMLACAAPCRCGCSEHERARARSHHPPSNVHMARPPASCGHAVSACARARTELTRMGRL